MFNNPEKKDVYILGAGNVARDVFDIYRELGISNHVKGFIEENSEREGQEIEGVKIFSDSILEKLDKKILLIAAIGLPTKQFFIEKAAALDLNFDTIVHPNAIFGSRVTVEEGCIIFPGVFLTHDIKIGRHSIVNVGSNISHDCTLGDFVTISPGVNIAGKVTIENGTWIGIGATIINKINIGQKTLIAAGAVVVGDIPDKVVAGGTPAKVIREWMNNDWEKVI